MVMVTLTQSAATWNILSQLNLGNISMSFIVTKGFELINCHEMSRFEKVIYTVFISMTQQHDTNFCQNVGIIMFDIRIVTRFYILQKMMEGLWFTVAGQWPA